ncbi:MAG: phosphate acetyltransferase [Candidatus Woesearchaeota archaeon]|nr:phosphate acetyltransferase [Candidatus Woesearchaeota archaeon]
MDLIKNLKKESAHLEKKIIFIEDDDSRVIDAVSIIANEKIAFPVLISDEKRSVNAIRKDILKAFSRLKIRKSAIERISIIDKNELDLDYYSEQLFMLRKEKGLSIEGAVRLLSDKIYLGTMMLKLGLADALISGAKHPTSHTLRPAFQIIKTRMGINLASGCLLIVHKLGNFIFADCGVNVNPNEDELAEIAISAAETAVQFGMKPKVAMLSFSTRGSAQNELVDKVRNAAEIAKKKRPDLLIEGEMQLDSAIVPEVCKRKFPGSKIMGRANVLIFPNLDSGNIGYKLVERFGMAKAVGPIVQGLSKPVNDLSRGCSTEDIVNLAAITAVQAKIFCKGGKC